VERHWRTGFLIGRGREEKRHEEERKKEREIEREREREKQTYDILEAGLPVPVFSTNIT
jgi:hypothetical protein